MKYKITVFNKENEVISSQIWYGTSLEDVDSWATLGMKILKQRSLRYEQAYYKIEEVSLEIEYNF